MQDLEGYYSPAVLARARKGVGEGAVVQKPNGSFKVSSASSDATYTTVILRDARDPSWVLYRTCTCANGQEKGGEAHCWHAAASEMIFASTNREDENDG